MANKATVTATPTPTTTPAPAPAVVPTVLGYRRAHPGGGVLGRCSYGIPGVAGIAVFDLGMFAGGVAPASFVPCTLVNGVYTPLAMAQPAARNVARVTSAVVAQGNAAVALATGQPIAAPATVAAVAAPAGVAALAKASK